MRPRERWIHFEDCHEPEICKSQEDSDKYGCDPEHLHVIEYSAYERVLKERDELLEALVKISLGHEHSCGTNVGVQCTCRAGIASRAIDEITR